MHQNLLHMWLESIFEILLSHVVWHQQDFVINHAHSHTVPVCVFKFGITEKGAQGV